MIHDILKEVGAHRKANGSGSEWFETTLVELDQIAAASGLLPASFSSENTYTSRRNTLNLAWNVLLHY